MILDAELSCLAQGHRYWFTDFTLRPQVLIVNSSLRMWFTHLDDSWCILWYYSLNQQELETKTHRTHILVVDGKLTAMLWCIQNQTRLQQLAARGSRHVGECHLQSQFLAMSDPWKIRSGFKPNILDRSVEWSLFPVHGFTDPTILTPDLLWFANHKRMYLLILNKYRYTHRHTNIYIHWNPVIAHHEWS